MKDAQLFKLVGKRIRQLRQERGWTQHEVSQHFGFNYKHYQRIEQGQQNLELATLNKLAATFEISIAEIFAFESASRISSSRKTNAAKEQHDK